MNYKMSPPFFIDVHFPFPPFGPFTYKVAGARVPEAGSRVDVPLGRRVVRGIAGGLAAEVNPLPDIKEVIRLVDWEPLIRRDIWDLVTYVGRRYGASVGEVLRLALPKTISYEDDDLILLTTRYLTCGAALLTETQKELAEKVGAAGWLPTRAVGEEEVVGALVAAGVLTVEPAASSPPRDDLYIYKTGKAVKLSAQEKEMEAKLTPGPTPFTAAAKDARGRAILRRLLAKGVIRVALAGADEFRRDHRTAARALVTGGNARSRLEAALGELKVANVEKVLLISPEKYRLSWAAEVAGYLWGAPFAIYHSELSPAARWEVWRRCRRGALPRVIGTRAALFLPAAADTAVCVLDEGDAGHKQFEMAPYYHTRVVALRRAAAAPAVFAASAPTLECYAAALAGNWRLLQLPTANAGDVTAVDMATVLGREGQVILSAALTATIGDALREGGRALVIVNRRGFIPYIFCRVCGGALLCTNCDVAFTYHKEEKVLLCHYCGRREPLPPRCPKCGKVALSGVGFGVEKLADEIRVAFPRARVGRADADALRTPAQARAFWARYAAGDYDIVVGTQMALRAADDERVTAAALANADTALTLPDFRAAEWTYRIIRRLAESVPKVSEKERQPPKRRVVVQTFFPAHYALRAAVEGDYAAFAAEELKVRQRLNLPPYCHLVNIIVSGKDRAAVEKRAAAVRDEVTRRFAGAAEITGPIPPVLSRLRGFIRRQVVIRADAEAIENNGPLLVALGRQGGPTRVTVDVDPLDLF